MYVPFDKVVFRFPRYPIETITKALSDDSYFREMIESPSFQEAVFFASPVLYDELAKFTANKLKEKERERTRNSLLKYLARMSTRCTPFGLFATCSTGELGEETAVVLSDRLKVHSRLDMLYLCNLSQELVRVDEMKEVVRYYRNTTLYAKSNKLRYIEYRFNAEQRVFQLVEISSNAYLQSIIKASEKGATLNEWIELLTSAHAEIDREMAVAYIHSIVENQVLVSEIDPIVTGDDFFTQIMSVVERLDPASKLYKRCSLLQSLIIQLNADDDAKNVFQLCAQIEEAVKDLNVPYQKKFLLQVDSLRCLSKGTVGKEVIRSLEMYMDFLNKVTAGNNQSALTEFKRAFYDRYEEREVSLLEALDPDLGLGYPFRQMGDISPLLGGLLLPNRAPSESFQTVVTPLHSLLQKKILNFNPLTDKEIILTDEDVKFLHARWDDLPATMYTLFQLVQSESDTKSHDLIVNGFSGSSAGNLLGRFAYCNEDVSGLVQEITDREKAFYSDSIVAEIAHIPDSRVGNILARPCLRDYEILYLANSTRSRDQIIYPSDLFLSVRNNQLVLRSKSLNRTVLPRLTTAHNFQNNPTPIYRFLCDLQTQNIRVGVSFNWGTLGQQLEYLPRVRYKNIIASLGKWNVSIKSIEHLIKQKDPVQLQEEVRVWQEKNRLPRYVLWAEGDNTLLVDFERIASVQAFLSALGKRSQIVLEEFIKGCPSLVRDEQGSGYANECIASFYASKPAPAPL